MLLKILLFMLGLALFHTPTPQPTLRVLTYNTHNEKLALEPLLDVLREADADIVALQEAHYEAVAVFHGLLLYQYPYQTEVVFGDDNHTMLMSRYPLLSVERWPAETIQMLRAEVDVNGVTVVIYNAHPSSPGNTDYDTTLRSEQIDLLLKAATKETAPLVIMGDFNMEEWSEDYTRLTAHYSDAFRALYPADEDAGFTYPDYTYPQSRRNARLPAFTPMLLRLDYIFHSAHFETVAAHVWPDSGGSDHRPVYAELRLTS